MRVILHQSIKGVGRVGEVKNVADGYGRNFLITRGLAKLATESTVKESEARKKKVEMQEKIQEEKAREIIDSIKDTVVGIQGKANDKGTLFKGIEGSDIAKALSSKISYNVTADMINLNQHIKHLGQHTVEIELAHGIKTQIIVEVKSE